jgi:hypothetical protein
MFRKQYLFLSSGEWGKTPTHLGPLERANLNHWTSRYLPPTHLRRETDTVYETSCFLFYRIPDDEKSPKTQ